ncbi:hypothetical protein MML48_4g00013344 [Holotrichia oblita]|uniref:Uncharacterized protein n=1 Tax=Holotrichia oblita TaxID=644536 RepID=A0ACB9T9C2_HOLOL|nr:hypothetical protein MML48_4g00013344 [Holotrichia oblita]
MESRTELKRKSSHPSNNQKKIMIEFLKKHYNLVSGKFSNNFTYKDAERLWQELTNILNSMPGAQKSWKNWRKTWQDLRSRTKCKLSHNKANMIRTGGGPYENEVYEEIDEEILSIIKVVSVEGHKEVEESNVNLNLVEDNLQGSIEEVSNKTCTSPIPCSSKVETTETPTAGRKIPKRLPTRLKHTVAAVDTYSTYLQEKMNIKQQYYQEKLQIMRESAEYQKETANALVHLAKVLEEFI